MYQSVIFAAVCALSSLACEITCIEDCHDGGSSNESRDEHSAGGIGSGGQSSGSANTSGGMSSAGNESSASANAPGTEGHSEPAPAPCSRESDCGRGFNCDQERKQCLAADAETCPELSTEADCDNRNDCVSSYAGTNCSCGPECTCIGGEPGCVCESFAFFSCEPLAG